MLLYINYLEKPYYYLKIYTFENHVPFKKHWKIKGLTRETFSSTL